MIYELLNGFTNKEERVREMIDGNLYFFLFLLKIFKLGMISRIQLFWNIVVQRIDQYVPHVKRINFLNIVDGLKLTLIFLLTMHWFACIWIGFRSDQNSSFIASYIPLDTFDMRPRDVLIQCFYVYVNASHFIITTMSTIGYGDIKPQNGTERLFGFFL